MSRLTIAPDFKTTRLIVLLVNHLFIWSPFLITPLLTLTYFTSFSGDRDSPFHDHSSELTRVNTLGDPSFSDSVGSSMVLRQAVISISQQLEDAESEYLSSRKELELVEIELSSVR